MKNIYWICSEGIIWSLYPNGNSNYQGLGQVYHNPDKKSILIVSFDDEIVGEYQAWYSLTELAQAIEGS